MWIEGTNYPDIEVEYDADENDLTISANGQCVSLTAAQIVKLAGALNGLIRTGELPE